MPITKRLSSLKWLASTILLSLIISACTEPPPDVPACEELTQHIVVDPVSGHSILKPSPTCQSKIGEDLCGHCVYIVSGKEIFVGEKTKLNGKAWSEIKSESVLMPAVESYAPLSTFIINTCKKMNCSSTVDAFVIKIGTLNTLQQ